MRGRQRARAVEDGFDLLRSVAATLSDAVGQTAVVLGTPDEALISFCRDAQAELLVVGSRGRGRMAAALLGSVSRGLADAGVCPLVVVSPEAADRFRARRQTGDSLFCGIDGSVDPVRAIQVAGDVAKQLEFESVPVGFGQLDAWHGVPPDDKSRRASKSAIWSRRARFDRLQVGSVEANRSARRGAL